MVVFLLKGIQAVASALSTAFGYMAIGHGTTAENVSQNGCITEDLRVATTNVIITTTNTNDTAQMTGNFTIAAATMAMTEAAVMTASTAGDGAARSMFSVVNLIQNDNVVLVFKFVVS